jgi:hypothetical protein
MQQFASRDLRVTSLPEDWAEGEDCGDCTKCTDNTEKPTESSASDRDLPALQEQLRVVRAGLSALTGG